MKIMDLLSLYAEITAEEQLIVQVGDTLPVGDKVTIDLPHAEKFAALLVKGHGGKRFRAVGIVFHREA